MKIPSQISTWLALGLSSQLLTGGDFYLKEGDRVVFYGDSITDQRLYTTFTETYVVTRFPKMDVSFVHSGWGGDRVSGGGGGPVDLRLTRDVLAYKPTVMTIMLGMNDGAYRTFEQGIFDTYANGYRHIVQRMKKEAPGIRITAIQPSPFDDVTREPKFPGGYNAVLVRYGEFVKDLASKEGLNVADLNTGVVEATKKADQINHDMATKLNPDRVHPGPGGQLLMAEGLLKSWNAPATVSAVEINGGAGKVTHAENTRVSGLKSGNAISWEQTDEALPMPINQEDPVVALAVKASDVMQALNQETLKVTGLKEGSYALKIDGSEVGKFKKEELEAGVNLAALRTPMSRQAADVHRLTLEHNNIHFTRWRQIQVPLASYPWNSDVKKKTEELMAAMDRQEQELVKQQRKLAQPVPHRYELVAE